jgi:tetratricopeptide (TPR) repeat protein
MCGLNNIFRLVGFLAAVGLLIPINIGFLWAINEKNFTQSSESSPQVVVEKLIEQSKLLEDTDISKSLHLASNAFEFAKEHAEVEGMMEALIQLNSLFFLQSDFESAMKTAEDLRKIATQHDSKVMIGYALLLEGRVFGELGAYDKSSEKFFESLRFFENLNHAEGIAESHGYIGNLFNTQGQHDKALEYLEKGLEIAREINNMKTISRQLNNIAVVYLGKQQYEAALIYLRESLAIDEIIGDKLNQGVTIFNIGYAELKQQKYDEAFGSFKRAHLLYSELGNDLQIARSHIAFASIYFELDSIARSQDYLILALNKGVEQGYHRIVYRAAKGLHQLSLQRSDTNSAYKYARIEKAAEDSLFTSNNQTQLAKLEYQYLYEKAELERRLALQTRNTLYTIVFVCLITGLIILSLLLSRNRIKAKKVAVEKQVVESQLEFKSKELTINLIALLKKNEMLGDISKTLIDIEKEAKKDETKEALARVRKEIRQNTDEKLLNEFSTRFQEVHTGFYEALLRKYPDLTQNELKLCAYLRLNMTSKDISELTGQRVLTLENARYRLRKKLGISNSDVNLVSFLSNI